mmetsp:Transcript_71419/g.158805  ORF Transcript_71419/g.158805 Transcript_71419/m.158805 type:complete len:149 (+) Transcript_71419:985-1431(+)
MRFIKKLAADKQSASSFDRFRNVYGFSAPTLTDAGWHLTSFGSVDDLLLKLTTFGAANRFTEADALNPHRLAACTGLCVELLNPDRKVRTPPPCHMPGNLTARWNGQPLLPQLRGRRRDSLVGADLPLPLLSHPSDYPSSWFTHIIRQ